MLAISIPFLSASTIEGEAAQLVAEYARRQSAPIAPLIPAKTIHLGLRLNLDSLALMFGVPDALRQRYVYIHQSLVDPDEHPACKAVTDSRSRTRLDTSRVDQ